MVNVHHIVSHKRNHSSLLSSLQFRIHPLAFACATAITFGLTTLSAQAADCNVVNCTQGLSGSAGTDASATAGAAGSNGQTEGNPGNFGVRGSDGGNAGTGGSGGAGGAASINASNTIATGYSLIGGIGGTGGNANGGNGGNGGSAAPGSTASGGNGGNAGQAGIGGNGGTGGSAISGTGLSVSNSGFLMGGAGGDGGNAQGGAGGQGGQGANTPGKPGNGGNGSNGGTAGNGGAGGIAVAGNSFQLVNQGSIIGGQGGVAGRADGGAAGGTYLSGSVGTQGESGTPGTYGAGGIGVVSSGSSSITTSGAISGGLAGDGTTRANAIELSGGNNILTLESGYSFVGHVISDGGDTLSLGGNTDGSFSVSNIASIPPISGTSNAQYFGFSDYVKTGSSTWVLTGTTTALTPWTINSGTLSLSNDSNLGAAGGSLTFGGGTLQNTSEFSTARNVLLNTSGAFQTLDNLTVTGLISGSGELIKTGSATLTLTNNNTYTGGTTLSSGTLQIGNGGATGSITGNILNNGHLVFNRIDSIAYAGIISGAGRLAHVGNGTLTLTGQNSYTGGTTINSGTLQIGNGGTTGAITGDILNNGSLVFNRSDSLTYGSVISGTGHFIKSGDGILTVLGNNTYTGGTTINSGTLQLGNGGTTGAITGNILNNSSLIFNRGDALTYGNVISGTGGVAKSGDGTLTLTGQNTYSGSTSITAGTLKTSANNVLANSGHITVAEGATLNLDGTNQVLQNLTNMGSILLADISAAVNPDARVASVPVSVTVTGDMTNSGTLFINNGNGTVENRYTQNGNWFGDTGSTVHMAAITEKDGSLTDKLIITGDATGSTVVSVSNLGGKGAKTINGIELIDVWGDSSDNAFIQAGRIVAGAYDYRLIEGDAFGQDSESWYLTSKQLTNDDNYRPEAGAYTANLIAANTMFNLSLNDRAVETDYIDEATGALKATSLWMRNVGGHQRFAMNDGQNKTQANRYVLQIGSDIREWSKNGNDSYRLGVMAGYANQQGNTYNHSSGNNAKSQINGYSMGAYATYFQDEKNKNGLYADTWLQYNWFNNTVSGNDLASESYKSSGVTASLEGGYTFSVGSYYSGDGMMNAFYLQPKAQVIWMGVKAKNHTESNGSVVQGNGNDNIQTRLGVKAILSGQSHLDKGTERQFRPFVEGNWLNNTQQYGVIMDGVASSVQGTRNIAELKAGVEGSISKNVDLWFGVTQQVGDKSYSDTQGSLGGRYHF